MVTESVKSLVFLSFPLENSFAPYNALSPWLTVHLRQNYNSFYKTRDEIQVTLFNRYCDCGTCRKGSSVSMILTPSLRSTFTVFYTGGVSLSKDVSWGDTVYSCVVYFCHPKGVQTPFCP